MIVLLAAWTALADVPRGDVGWDERAGGELGATVGRTVPAPGPVVVDPGALARLNDLLLTDDGRWLVASTGGGVWVVDLSAGRVARRLNGVRALAVAGDHLAILGDDGTARTVVLGTGEEVAEARLSGAVVGNPWQAETFVVQRQGLLVSRDADLRTKGAVDLTDIPKRLAWLDAQRLLIVYPRSSVVMEPLAGTITLALDHAAWVSRSGEGLAWYARDRSGWVLRDGTKTAMATSELPWLVRDDQQIALAPLWRDGEPVHRDVDGAVPAGDPGGLAAQGGEPVPQGEAGGLTVMPGEAPAHGVLVRRGSAEVARVWWFQGDDVVVQVGDAAHGRDGARRVVGPHGPWFGSSQIAVPSP